MNLFDNKNSWAEIQVREGAMQIRRWTAETRHDHFLGLDAGGRYLYLLRLPSAKKVLPALPTVSGCASGILQTAEGVFFCLTLKNKAEWGIFKLLTQMLIEDVENVHADDDASVAVQLKVTLKRCADFFRKETAAFGRRQAVGLLGELVFLEHCVIPAVGWAQALRCWKGPLGAPQDFGVQNTTVEVKCTESASRQCIHISNAEQLATGLAQGFLCVVGVSGGVSAAGETLSLNRLVQELQQGFERETGGAELFLSLLDRVGYAAASPESAVPYRVLDMDFYALREGFPRILPATLPPGIGNLQYTVDLNLCASFKQLPPWFRP